MGFAFSDTITGGIQDVSALLSLLGTEQCEGHVGSALVDGYIYAAVASLSLFGSLGLARAGFKALAASIVIVSLGARNKVIGAEKLADAGFAPAGKALSQIMWSGGCHVAEREVTALLERLNIDNVQKLSVEATNWIWNLKMVLASLIAVVASITPYVYLIKNNRDDAKSLRWFFPLARSMGSFIISNMVQIIIQTRLLEIIKHRLVFMTLDTIVRDESID